MLCESDNPVNLEVANRLTIWRGLAVDLYLNASVSRPQQPTYVNPRQRHIAHLLERGTLLLDHLSGRCGIAVSRHDGRPIAVAQIGQNGLSRLRREVPGVQPSDCEHEQNHTGGKNARCGSCWHEG